MSFFSELLSIFVPFHLLKDLANLKLVSHILCLDSKCFVQRATATLIDNSIKRQLILGKVNLLLWFSAGLGSTQLLRLV